MAKIKRLNHHIVIGIQCWKVKCYKRHYDYSLSEDSTDIAEESSISFSCPMYQVYRRSDGSISLTIHKSYLTSDTGVDVQLSNKDEKQGGFLYYHNCFIENEAGKTIESFRATDDSPKCSK